MMEAEWESAIKRYREMKRKTKEADRTVLTVRDKTRSITGDRCYFFCVFDPLTRSLREARIWVYEG